MSDMVMIPREVLENYRECLVQRRERFAGRPTLQRVVENCDADLAHIAAALDDGTDPETKE